MIEIYNCIKYYLQIEIVGYSYIHSLFSRIVENRMFMSQKCPHLAMPSLLLVPSLLICGSECQQPLAIIIQIKLKVKICNKQTTSVSTLSRICLVSMMKWDRPQSFYQPIKFAANLNMGRRTCLCYQCAIKQWFFLDGRQPLCENAETTTVVDSFLVARLVGNQSSVFSEMCLFPWFNGKDCGLCWLLQFRQSFHELTHWTQNVCFQLFSLVCTHYCPSFMHVDTRIFSTHGTHPASSMSAADSIASQTTAREKKMYFVGRILRFFVSYQTRSHLFHQN